MSKKEKLAVWLIALANPILGWAVTYLLWHESAPEKQRYGARASLYVFIFVAALFILAVVAGLTGSK